MMSRFSIKTDNRFKLVFSEYADHIGINKFEIYEHWKPFIKMMEDLKPYLNKTQLALLTYSYKPDKMSKEVGCEDSESSSERSESTKSSQNYDIDKMTMVEEKRNREYTVYKGKRYLKLLMTDGKYEYCFWLDFITKDLLDSEFNFVRNFE